MKNITPLTCIAFLLLSITTLTGCHFSAGTNKDLKTGLSSSYYGFSVEDVFLANSSKERLSSNKIPLNSTFLILATGVGNYTLKDGKAYPGCEITIKDKSGKTVGHIDNAMSDISSSGLPPEGATTLSARVTLYPPFVAGETYHVSVRFFDNQNEKNKITADIDIVLQ
ncbi:hypothetical protein IDJ75_03380 [Mucilaginibacter rigui]|uniref:DUF4625 domain-containing protein n=1 Tax=Mucilaginibacter rigui TaxID=534635 RepID=A0ABR7X136_9SPHI|nr:hypothetical protein [Mucilaginibacter rigui]MBD1384307.1 hypothetical protein [Mucilaginibacter rigui]